MLKISFSDGIGIGGIVLAILLVVLDKAGKLKGYWIPLLLFVAGVMTLFIALGNSWVTESPTKWKLWRGALMFCVVAFTYSAIAIWVSSGNELPTKKRGGGSPTDETKTEGPVAANPTEKSLSTSANGGNPTPPGTATTNRGQPSATNSLPLQTPQQARTEAKQEPPASPSEPGLVNARPQPARRREVTHTVPPPRPSGTAPILKDQVLALCKELATWSLAKFKERGDKSKFENLPNPNEYSKVRAEYDQEARMEFDGKFLQRLNEIVKKLDRCNADTTKLKEAVRTATRVEQFHFIAVDLQAVAHNIPEGQPECGTGEPTQGFGTKDTGQYTLLLGESYLSHYREYLEQGSGMIKLGGLNSFKIYLRNGIFCIDAQVYGGFGMPLIEVVCNHVTAPPSWDTNYTDEAIEVVDQNQVPMFQMIFESKTKIRVNGVFPADNNQLMIVTPLDTKKIDLPRQSPIDVPLKRLFKYPAWKFPHQYAD
jgi:hypothetical protein